MDRAHDTYKRKKRGTIIYSLEPTHAGLWRVAMRDGSSVTRTRPYPLHRAKRIYDAVRKR